MAQGEPETTVVIVHDGVEVASWPLPGPGRHDLSVVDDLARLALAARRMGFAVRLRNPSARLVELLDLVGLTSAGCLGVEVRGESERGEQLGVQERMEPGDPLA